MASVLPAMRGKFGSTEYYIVSMPAKELTERLVVPKNVDGWEEMSIEERYQREINYNRVKRQIAPYLVEDEDRFFGAFIVSMINSDGVEFETITNIFKGNVPNLYKSAGAAFGFLTLQGSEILVPLDGQHRLAALQFAITGKDEKQQPIRGLEANAEVANDDCTVVLIKHDAIKSRKIFNKVNRYAKATTKAENLITADDDVIAVVVREAVVGSSKIIPDRLINARSNTLAVKALEFTTLSTLYECTKFLLEDLVGKINTQILPDKQKQKTMETEAIEFWETVCDKVHLFSDALADPSEAGDKKRQEIRRDYLLGKPVAQWALVQSIVRMREEDTRTGSRISLDEACRRMNQLDWSVTDGRWQQVLLNGDRVLSGKTAVNFASQVIAYWLGARFSDDQVTELKERYRRQSDGNELSTPVVLSE